MKAEEVSEDEEAAGGEEGEEGPSMNVIPGWEPSEQKSRPKNAQSKAQLRVANEDSSVSSSLGELRFQDE